MVTTNWYIVQVYSGYENRVVESLNELIVKKDLQDSIEDILVPTHTVSQVRYGKKIELKKKFLPGYVLLKMIMSEEIFLLIRSIPRVSSFVGGISKDGLPYPVSQEEIDKLLNNAVDRQQDISELALRFDVGESVNIINGPFSSFTGVIEEVDTDRKKLILSVLNIW